MEPINRTKAALKTVSSSRDGLFIQIVHSFAVSCEVPGCVGECIRPTVFLFAAFSLPQTHEDIDAAPLPVKKKKNTHMHTGSLNSQMGFRKRLYCGE